ncbi:hypothetical protein AWB65_05892 [Caballeronia humi]|uniref:Uncharacterized protein n=1 Tax=Caballeronia humi TaxID=326474 RepID=A0A158J3I9_9BURK|nr:hypothetical protein AWB65_05892 [Caballeronia humi]
MSTNWSNATWFIGSRRGVPDRRERSLSLAALRFEMQSDAYLAGQKSAQRGPEIIAFSLAETTHKRLTTVLPLCLGPCLPRQILGGVSKTAY